MCPALCSCSYQLIVRKTPGLRAILYTPNVAYNLVRRNKLNANVMYTPLAYRYDETHTTHNDPGEFLFRQPHHLFGQNDLEGIPYPGSRLGISIGIHDRCPRRHIVVVTVPRTSFHFASQHNADVSNSRTICCFRNVVSKMFRTSTSG